MYLDDGDDGKMRALIQTDFRDRSGRLERTEKMGPLTTTGCIHKLVRAPSVRDSEKVARGGKVPTPQIITTWVTAVRRNHAAEHATIAVASRRLDRVGQLGGRAVLNGFYVYGPVSTEVLEESAREAVQRLKGGEAGLAVSPFCGTNFLLAGALTTLSAAAVLGNRDRFQRLPQAMGLGVFTLIGSFRAGAEVQRRWTTKADVGRMAVERVVQKRGGRNAVHRVYTQVEPEDL
jgi:hypothetical protein